MTVTIRAFAGARDVVGQGRFALELAGPATLGDVWRELCRSHPRLDDLAVQGLALNRAFAADDAPVNDGDEVAIIPPVSGG